MTPADAWGVLTGATEALVGDEASDAVWAGEFEGRWGVRMAQQARDFTTVWFEVGERSLGYEAYVLPAPPAGREEVYRQALLRNRRAWLAFFSLDTDGDLYLRGRVPLDMVTPDTVDQILGAIYSMVEVAFRPFLRAGFPRREKSP